MFDFQMKTPSLCRGHSPTHMELWVMSQAVADRTGPTCLHTVYTTAACVRLCIFPLPRPKHSHALVLSYSSSFFFYLLPGKSSIPQRKPKHFPTAAQKCRNHSFQSFVFLYPTEICDILSHCKQSSSLYTYRIQSAKTLCNAGLDLLLAAASLPFPALGKCFAHWWHDVKNTNRSGCKTSQIPADWRRGKRRLKE